MSPVAGGPVRPARSRIVKAGDVARMAATTTARAEQAAQQALDAQVREAYARGVADGRAAAEQAAAGAAATAAQRGAAAVEALAAEAARLEAADVDATSAAVLQAALELTGWVLRAEPGEASRSLLTRLTEAARTLSMPAGGATTVVRVNAADLDVVRQWARAGVEVVPDARLAPGEARLDRGEGSAVLTFGAALRRAADTLGVPLGTGTTGTGTTDNTGSRTDAGPTIGMREGRGSAA